MTKNKINHSRLGQTRRDGLPEVAEGVYHGLKIIERVVSFFKKE